MRILLSSLFAAVLLVPGAAFAQSAAPKAQSDTQEQQKRSAEQPGNNAPVMREIKSGQPQYTSIPGRETSVLIQPPARFLGQNTMVTAGEAWRQFRNGPVTFIGGWVVVIVLLILAAVYFGKGPIKLHDRPSGRLLRRFSTFEQVVHWSVAISFCVLGLSGLIMLFGKHVLLPVIGYTLFAWLTSLSKNLHNFIAPLFMVSVIAMVIIWARDNLPKSYDFMWFRRAWGFFMRGEHIPSGRFNAGEKTWFWVGVVVLSVIVSWSGVILLFPNFDQSRAVMQDAWIWHATAALIYIAISFGHIYMGTIGVEGAYGNMRTGFTDETWAREHHEYWYNEVKLAERSAPGGAVPAGAPHQKEDA
jgi:formate dehydrogenase subunit gamma